MRIESIRYDTVDGFEIIELKVRGKEEFRDSLFRDIQEDFSLAHDETTESHAMLTMTFDKIPKKQTLAMIKSYVANYIYEYNKKS